MQKSLQCAPGSRKYNIVRLHNKARRRSLHHPPSTVHLYMALQAPRHRQLLPRDPQLHPQSHQNLTSRIHQRPNLRTIDIHSLHHYRRILRNK